MLFLIRSADDVRAAVEAAREYLVYRRQSFSRSGSATETFFPVFAAADAVESIKATMSELEDRYPQMIGGTWFLDDRKRGIVPARG